MSNITRLDPVGGEFLIRTSESADPGEIAQRSRALRASLAVVSLRFYGE
jgi:hypothetical protein